VSLLQSIAAFTRGGVTATQAYQRDWSPFLVHLTRAASMDQLRSAVLNGMRPMDVSARLLEADDSSFETVNAIFKSAMLMRSPSTIGSDVPTRVCLSECILAGLLAMSDRYGRFGFVYRKQDVFDFGGRPCAYVDQPSYDRIKQRAQARDADEVDRQIHAITNVYRPKAPRFQDFTHEREWRVLKDMPFAAVAPIALVCPARFVNQIRERWEGPMQVIDIEMLFEWGA